MVDPWNAEMIRLPLEITDEEEYIEDSTYYKTLFDSMIQACVAKGFYVVVTWRSSALDLNVQEQS